MKTENIHIQVFKADFQKQLILTGFETLDLTFENLTSSGLKLLFC